MRMLTRWAALLSLAVAMALPLSARAALITLNPGLPLTSLGAGTTAAADPSMAGLAIADQTQPFTGTGFSGQYQTRVVKRDDTGTLDFYYRIVEFHNPGAATLGLRDFRMTGFGGWGVQVSYRPDGVGGEGPQQAVRFPTPACPAPCEGINFVFADLNDGGNSNPTLFDGEDSYFMLVRTAATAYTTSAADVLLTSLAGQPFRQVFSAPFSIFTPSADAVPEPRSLALVLAALGALAVTGRRRRA